MQWRHFLHDLSGAYPLQASILPCGLFVCLLPIPSVLALTESVHSMMPDLLALRKSSTWKLRACKDSMTTGAARTVNAVTPAPSRSPNARMHYTCNLQGDARRIEIAKQTATFCRFPAHHYVVLALTCAVSESGNEGSRS